MRWRGGADRLKGNSSSSQLVALFFAVGRVVERVVEVFAFAFAFAALRCGDQTRQGGRVSVYGGPVRGHEFGAQQRREVPGEQQREQVAGGDRRAAAGAVGLDDARAQRPAAHPAHDLAQVGHRVSGHVRARVRGAYLAQHARDRLEGLALERFGPVGRYDRVEDQRFDVLGIVLRVLLGHLRAVARAVQDELFVAPRLADRLDVCDRVGGRVEDAVGPQLRAARVDQRAEAAVQVGPFEGVAGQRLGQADAALVEDDQVARGGDRAEQFGELFGERQRRLSGPAGERDDRAPGFAHGRTVAAQRERDRARRRAAGVQRHRQMTAGEVVAVAARSEGDLRVSCRGGRARPRARGRDERSQGVPARSHGRNLFCPSA
jgi:hypothetical protein